MKKFVAAPFDQYGNWIVERWNEIRKKYERFDPKDSDTYLSEMQARQKAEYYNGLQEK